MLQGFRNKFEAIRESLHSISMECGTDKDTNLKWAYIFLLYNVHVLGLNSFA